jgi:hypothetical protein
MNKHIQVLCPKHGPMPPRSMQKNEEETELHIAHSCPCGFVVLLLGLDFESVWDEENKEAPQEST